MKRLMMMAASFSATLALAIGSTWAIDGRAALREGRSLYGYRGQLESAALQRLAAGDAPLRVLWLGDSTMLGDVSAPAYPERVRGALGDAVGHIKFAIPALDVYQHYYEIGELMTHEPDVVVIALHLRLFGTATRAPRNDLASHLPLAELPRAATLPLHERGLSLPKLLMLRALRFESVERAMFFFTGLRQQLHDAEARVFPPARERVDLERAIADALDAYDVEVWGRAPMLRMLDAVVANAREGGADVLVVVSPVPWHAMQTAGRFDAKALDRRVAVVREVVEARGARLLDLHRALDPADHSDILGHTHASGHAKVAGRIAPLLEEMLEQRR